MLKQISEFPNITRIYLEALDNCWPVHSVEVTLPDSSSPFLRQQNIVVADMFITTTDFFVQLENYQAKQGQFPYVNVTIHRSNAPDHPFRINDGYISFLLYEMHSYLPNRANVQVIGTYTSSPSGLFAEEVIAVTESNWIDPRIKEAERKNPSLQRFRNVLE